MEYLTHLARHPAVRIIADYLKYARKDIRLFVAVDLVQEANKPVVILEVRQYANSRPELLKLTPEP